MISPAQLALDLRDRGIASLEHWLRSPINFEGACWIPQKKPGSQGYVQIKHREQYFRAHRLSYRYFRGPIPSDKQLDHLCRRRNCVNPAHLEIVTSQENTLRGQGPTAIAARRTHCIWGHAFNVINTHVAKNGTRHCRACDCFRARRKRMGVRFPTDGNAAPSVLTIPCGLEPVCSRPSAANRAITFQPTGEGESSGPPI